MPQNENDPFPPSKLEAHQVTDIVAKIEEKIEALPEAEAEAALEKIQKAIEARQSGGEIKAILSSVVKVALPFIPI